MSLKSSIDKLKYDARMVDINLKNQVLERDELKKHLESLPDLQSAALSLDLEAEDYDQMNGAEN